MKIFCSLVLAASLFLSTSTVPQVKPAPVEYNLGSCASEFTVIHVVIASGKMTITHMMPGPGEVVKYDEPFVFDYTEGKKDEKGNLHFTGKTIVDKKNLELNGLIRGERLVGILSVDGELGHVFYGQVGKVEDMVKNADEDLTICIFLHQVEKDQIPSVIEKFLDKQ